MIQEVNEVVVSGGSVLFFLNASKGSDKADVVNAQLYAQLTSSDKYSKFAELNAWKGRYFAASTSALGWKLGPSENISKPMTDQIPGTVWEWIRIRLPELKFAAKFEQDLAGLQHAEATARLSYHAHPDQRAFGLLARQVLLDGQALTGGLQTETTTLALQLGFVGAMSSVTLVQIGFTTRQQLKSGFLFETLKPEEILGNIDLHFSSMHLDDRVYSKVRDVISARLRDKRPELVCPLQEADNVQ